MFCGGRVERPDDAHFDQSAAELKISYSSDDLVRGLSTQARACVPILMTTIDSRVAREAEPTGYLSGVVLPNQARLEFDS